MYLGLCLGSYSILVTASLGGVYIYSCCSYYNYYKIAGAAIRVTSGTVIKTTYSTAIKIAGEISGTASGISKVFYRRCCGRYW